jgi:hypothetical protein
MYTCTKQLAQKSMISLYHNIHVLCAITSLYFLPPIAPSAPGNFRVTSSSSSSVSLAWDVPDPLNGQLAAYELSYTDETTSVTNTRLLFAVTRFTVAGLRVGVVYRVELRASTASLLGDFLYGRYAVLRVRDGVELEVPTEAPPTTVPPTTTEEVEETTTPSGQETTQAGVATTTDRQVGMTTATTMVATTTAPPITTELEQTTTPPPVTTTPVVLNPPSVAPSDLVVQASAGQLFIVWRVRAKFQYYFIFPQNFEIWRSFLMWI